MSDHRWLEQRARGWYCVKDVPRPLRAALGKKRFVASLQTCDIHVAIARRHTALASFEAEIAKVRHTASGAPLIDAGMEWRGVFARIDQGNSAQLAAFGSGYPERHYDPERGNVTLTPQQRARDGAETVMFEEAERIREEQGEEAAGGFLALAQGHATPLLHYVGAWLAEGGARGPVAERTQRQYRSDLAELAAWAASAGVSPTIEAFTAKVVGRFITEAMVGAGANRKTANRKISAASSYWRWLAKRAVVDGNPWQNQSLSKARPRDAPSTEPRPFTDAELATLLSGNPGTELADAIRIGALSGMRIEETYRLTVADCADGWFNIRRSKTMAGVRRVPIHSDLTPIIARRAQGRAPIAYVFPEAGPLRPGCERSMAASKRFGRYRIRLGVDERPEGQRHSLINYHSLRRWFVTKARAGFDRAVVAAVVGHEVGNMTDDVYSGGPSDAAKVACVASVRLPPPPPPSAS